MKYWFGLICLFGFSTFAIGDRIRYDNYKLLRFTPSNDADLKLLFHLQESNFGVIFWKEPSRINSPVDIVFPPHLQGDTFEFLKQRFVTDVLSDNVQNLIDNEAKGLLQHGRAFNWDSYGTLDEIYEFLDSTAGNNTFVEVVKIGESYEKRDLKVLKISKSSDTDRPAIWIDAAIHASEWISPAVATYVINELLTSNDTDVIKITEDFDLYIMPVMNPDGYVFAHDHNRLWRKTRAITTNEKLRVDANRNWDYEFNTGGSSSDPCSDGYHGGAAFNQPETKAVSDYYNTIATQTKMYLTLHSYSQYIMLPFGCSNQTYPDYDDWMRIAEATSRAIADPFGTQFQWGNIVDLLYISSGGSVDWIKGIHDTNIVLAFELRDFGRHGLILPPEQIRPSGIEFMKGFKELVRQLRNRLEMP
ncbi:unnamed protein product [Orchesella dallaii]|uniref:Peptidase M14 domain-containing protein n=1 Tax=Orchesella dallaii TaxID=48710 RepID=A0ABP1RYZ2_9HEXA